VPASGVSTCRFGLRLTNDTTLEIHRYCAKPVNGQSGWEAEVGFEPSSRAATLRRSELDAHSRFARTSAVGHIGKTDANDAPAVQMKSKRLPSHSIRFGQGEVQLDETPGERLGR